MNNKKKIRIALDSILTILIIAAMFIQYTGTFLHEIIGFIFFAAVITHLILSATWIKKTASDIGHRKASKRRIALSAIGIALSIAMIILGISSIAISTIFASWGFVFPFGEYSVWTYLHSLSSYSLCAIVVIHLAMHWAFIASVFKLTYDKKNRRAVSAGVYASALVGVGVLGGCAAKIPFPYNESNVTPLMNSITEQNDNVSTDTMTNDAASNKKQKISYRRSEPTQISASQENENWYVQGAEQSDDNTGAGGICTLCHKGCSLSAPKCERPYAEGLIPTSQNK